MSISRLAFAIRYCIVGSDPFAFESASSSFCLTKRCGAVMIKKVTKEKHETTYPLLKKSSDQLILIGFIENLGFDSPF
jgi:hypothetical protein